MPIKISDRPTARRRKNLVTLFNNTTIIPFKWRGKYLCFYCGDERPEYDDLKKHTKSHGHCSTKDYAIQGVKSGEVEVKLDVSEIYCELCSAPCNDIDEIISHLNTKHNLKYDRNIDMCFMPYRLIDLKCVACDEYFKFFNRLVNHVNVNHPQNRLVCDQCSQPFNKKRDLGSHIRNYHRQGGYRCDDCDLDFASQTKLRTHKQVVHLHSCNVCFKQFSTSAKKLKHIASAHISGGTLRCEFCLKIWATKQSFLQHSSKCRIRKEVADTAVMDTSTVDDEHRKIGVKNIRTNLAILFNMTTIYPFKFFMGKFRCFNCGKNFTESEDMKEHWMLEHPYCDIKHKSMKLRSREDIYIKVDVSTLACRVCFESMSDVDYLIDHLITLHDAAFDKSIDCKLQTFRLLKDHYLCPLCPNSETFVYFGNVLKHMNKEHSNNNLLCMYCGEAFRCDPNLRAHISRHHKLARYKCLACKLDFNSKTTLNTHLAKVHGRKIHICSKCPEKFTSTYLRQKHLIVAHNCGFKCTYCEKKFTRYSFMRDHISRTHLREKKVECSICNARFFDNFMLRMHMVKHTGDRNFHCDLCGKKFLWKKNLRGHMASHSRQTQLGNYIIPK